MSNAFPPENKKHDIKLSKRFHNYRLAPVMVFTDGAVSRCLVSVRHERCAPRATVQSVDDSAAHDGPAGAELFC